MRRAFAGLLLSLGLLLGSLTLSSWWIQRTAFDANRTGDIATAALGNADVRSELATQISDRVAPLLGIDPRVVQNVADATLARPDLAPAFSTILRDVHARLIGTATGPVTIGPDLVAQVVNDPRAAQLPAVSFTVPTISPIDTTRRALAKYTPVGLLFAVLLAGAGLALHPSTATALRTIGGWLIGASLVQLLLSYGVPVLLVPALTDNPWAQLVAEVSKATIGPLIGILVMLFGGGIACFVAAAYLDHGRRRPPPAAPRGPSYQPTTRYPTSASEPTRTDWA
jgi:hypothetical protein